MQDHFLFSPILRRQQRRAHPQPAGPQIDSSQPKHGHDEEKETTRRQAGIGELRPVYAVEAKNIGLRIGNFLPRERVDVTKPRHAELRGRATSHRTVLDAAINIFREDLRLRARERAAYAMTLRHLARIRARIRNTANTTRAMA